MSTVPTPPGDQPQFPETGGAYTSKKDAKAHAKADRAYRKASRPWFKKKRFWLLGLLILIILIFALSQGGGDDKGGSPSNETSSGAPSSAAESAAPEAEEEASAEDSAPEETEVEMDDDMTESQRNAVRSAENYLAMIPFSRQGLIDQLSSEYGDKYSVEDATFAVDQVEAQIDWNEQAAKAAENYLDTLPFSRQGLIDQLSSEAGDKYTVEQATAGVDAIEDSVDWNEQAAKAAQNYLDTMPFSRDALIEQLSSDFGDKFTLEQATYGVDQTDL